MLAAKINIYFWHCYQTYTQYGGFLNYGLPFVCLPVAVIVELIVWGESDEASPSSRQREEDLSGCVFPHLTEEALQVRKKQLLFHAFKQTSISYLCIVEFLPLWCDKVEDAVSGPREGHSSDQQDDQHHVGKCGCEIHHLTTVETRWGEMKERRRE